ncbi:MAG: FliA/WhiG family RNA polymerase sigma factor [Verrucomicrobiota bacterium]|nr:FliA/WhiG family RNA polymerase sigma factor [Verrucomicrobiota bacterium]
MPTCVAPSTANQKSRKLLSQRYAKIKPGNAAEAEMVEQYLPLVKTVVGRLAVSLPPHVDAEDLYSSGLVGLLNAVRNFDPEGGSTFESYARVRIRGAIFDELRRLDWVPRSVHDKARKVQTIMQRLEQQNGCIPTNAQMAHALDITVEEYEELLTEIRPATFVCLDAAPSGDDDGDSSRYDSIADQSQENPVDATARRELARVIADRLEQLPEMQRKVLALYYFEDLRLREIAEVFGVTESRICQIHAQAILSLKSFLQQHETPGIKE